MNHRMLLRILITALVACGIAAFFTLGLERSFTLDALRDHGNRLMAMKDHSPLLATGAFVLLHIVVTALAVPGGISLTMGAGALFGLAGGTLLASVAVNLGGTLTFLGTRYLLRGVVRRRFPARLEQVERGLQRGGSAYLFCLRLLPVVPFVVVNTLFGMTNFPVRRFYWISQLGLLPVTLIYVNAGTQLRHIENLSDILSPAVLASLALLAALSLVARAARGLRGDSIKTVAWGRRAAIQHLGLVRGLRGAGSKSSKY